MKAASGIALQTTHLTVGYGGHRLFENLSISMQAGELVCFMGPNGAGKSSLIRTLAGIQSPLEGTVTFSKGNDIHDQVAVVLTDKVPSPYMSVYELITFGRYPYLDWHATLSTQDRRILDDAIDLVHVRHLVHKKLFQLSDGQTQLVMIARALAQTTPVILLDEPTAHLDLNNRVEVMRLLRNLARQTGKAILVATHELDLALQTADLIWLTGQQKNIITGIPEDLVLNGTFDAIFEFKGFNLKTGKVQHEAFRNKTIQVNGSGHHYLWTRNALERNGFEISTEHQPWQIIPEDSGHWTVVIANQRYTCQSIREVLSCLLTVGA
jgi:iron complex transport system ATP-binding protein